MRTGHGALHHAHMYPPPHMTHMYPPPPQVMAHCITLCQSASLLGLCESG
jgi:hypothetical protein